MNKLRLSVSLSPKAVERVKHRALAEGRSVSSAIERLILEAGSVNVTTPEL